MMDGGIGEDRKRDEIERRGKLKTKNKAREAGLFMGKYRIMEENEEEEEEEEEEAG